MIENIKHKMRIQLVVQQVYLSFEMCLFEFVVFTNHFDVMVEKIQGIKTKINQRGGHQISKELHVKRANRVY